MAYRQLTNDEIIQLGQELSDLRSWEAARDYVSALYGLEARSPSIHHPHQITITIVSERTKRRDMVSYRKNVNIIVTDRQNHIIPYDLSRYWWSHLALSEEAIQVLSKDTSGKLDIANTLDDDTVYNSDDDSPLYIALKDFCTEKLGIGFQEYFGQPHDPITYTYLIDTPPFIVSFSAVYVIEEPEHA